MRVLRCCGCVVCAVCEFWSKVQIQNLFLTAQSTQIKSLISVPIKDFIHHYPRALFNDIPRVGAYFYDIPGSGRSLTTYPGLRSKVRPRTFGCVAMGSALLCIFRSRLLVYSAGSGMNRVQVVLSGFSIGLVCFVQKLYVGMVVYISWLHSCMCVWM